MNTRKILLILAPVLACTACEQEGELASGVLNIARENAGSAVCNVSHFEDHQQLETYDASGVLIETENSSWANTYVYDGTGLLMERQTTFSSPLSSGSYSTKYLRNSNGYLQREERHQNGEVGSYIEYERTSSRVIKRGYHQDGTLQSTTFFEFRDGYISHRSIVLHNAVDGSEETFLESDYTWSNDNLVERQTRVFEQGNPGEVSYTVAIRFNYDDKINPFAYTISPESHYQNSLNNVTSVTRETTRAGIITTSEVNYSYVYNSSDYPIEVKIKSENQTGTNGNQVWNSTYSYAYDNCN